MYYFDRKLSLSLCFTSHYITTTNQMMEYMCAEPQYTCNYESEVYSRLLPATFICVLDKDMCLYMCVPDVSELCSRISLFLSVFA